MADRVGRPCVNCVATSVPGRCGSCSTYLLGRLPGRRYAAWTGPFHTVSFNGSSSIKVPESDRNVDWVGSQSRGGYPRAESNTSARPASGP